jgi:hypothetical protein
MVSATILVPAVLNGLMNGAVYALVALGLTLIYGVLHIINFAHGALLTAAMFAAFFAHQLFGLDPYIAALFLTPLFFLLGYGLQRFVIGPASHGEDRNSLLVTLGLAVIIENALLYAFRADTRTINLPYAFDVVEIGTAFLAVPRVVAFGAAIAVALCLWLIVTMDRHRQGHPARLPKLGAELWHRGRPSTRSRSGLAPRASRSPRASLRLLCQSGRRQCVRAHCAFTLWCLAAWDQSWAHCWAVIRRRCRERRASISVNHLAKSASS